MSIITVASGCASPKESTSISDENQNTTVTVSNDVEDVTITGLWQMTIQTRRGNRESELSIFEEDGNYKGKTDRTVFTIVKNGDVLTWTSNVDSPMGKIKAQHRMTVKGNTMNGTVKASGRTLNASGIRK